MKFQCQESCGGKCCKIPEGKQRFVFLTKTDRENIARFTKSPIEKFAQVHLFTWTRFTKYPTKQWVLHPNGDACVFLDDFGKCTIYEARPTQCRTFPFWPEYMPKEKFEAVKDLCPGIGVGDEEFGKEKFREQLRADIELSGNADEAN